jgi:hypothetical protein
MGETLPNQRQFDQGLECPEEAKRFQPWSRRKPMSGHKACAPTHRFDDARLILGFAAAGAALLCFIQILGSELGFTSPDIPTRIASVLFSTLGVVTLMVAVFRLMLRTLRHPPTA